jgi:hypothetical protein
MKIYPKSKSLEKQLILFTLIGSAIGLIVGLVSHQHIYYSTPIGGVVGYMIRSTMIAADGHDYFD